MKLYFNCTQCRKEYFRHHNNDGSGVPKNPFCSQSCKGVWQSENLRGESNPNYNNKWDESQKKNLSEKTSAAMTPERRAEIGDQHRGKKLSPETIEKIHGHRTSESYSRPCPESSKALIGKKSAEKFLCPEYKLKYRKTMEERGHWTPLENREAYSIYKDASDWVGNMFEDLDKTTIDWINSVGMFNPKKNSKGIVRDHKFSRKHGLDNLVFPEILRHPCNCEFITHGKNSGKSYRSSITLEDLFDAIKNYDGDWHEHQRVLDLVDSYENGFRWDIKQFIEGHYNV